MYGPTVVATTRALLTTWSISSCLLLSPVNTGQSLAAGYTFAILSRASSTFWRLRPTYTQTWGKEGERARDHAVQYGTSEAERELLAAVAIPLCRILAHEHAREASHT